MGNRECVVKSQPYPNVPVYVVCHRNGEVHSQILHRNYLLPISSNIEQNEKDLWQIQGSSWHLGPYPQHVGILLKQKNSWCLQIRGDFLLGLPDQIQDSLERTYLWQELNTQAPQLQCLQWTVSLLTQRHLGWPHHTQQTTCPRVVQINLLYSDMAHIQPGTNSHGGARTLDFWQILAHLASGMHGLVCVFVFILYHVCTLFLWEGQCKHTLLVPSHVCWAPLTLALRGVQSM